LFFEHVRNIVEIRNPDDLFDVCLILSRMNKSYLQHCNSNDSETVITGRGFNVIPEAEKEPIWKAFLQKFREPIIIILLVVLCLSFGISFYELLVLNKPASCLIEPVGILIAIILATGIGFLFEYNAEKEFQILNKKKDERLVKVLRWPNKSSKRSQVFQIKKCDVVCGDIVVLEAGDEVPADGIICESQALRVDESNYTGEMYANKSVDENSHDDSTYPSNFLLRGSIVLEGSCVYQVNAVGKDTEEGKGAAILQKEDDVETPLNLQLDKLAKWITKASYVIAALIVIGRLLYFFFAGNGTANSSILEIIEFTLNSIMIAVTLIVVAVPEGLPMSVTISLALSMRKMLKENNLVRKLHACETMGATTVICTDKTGTLTKNKMKVREFKTYNLENDQNFRHKAIVLNCTAYLSQEGNRAKTIGNITEGALLYWLYKYYREKRWAEVVVKEGKDTYSETANAIDDVIALKDTSEIIEQKLFTPETKYMTTVVRDNETGRKYKYFKGAPEVICAMCTNFGTADRGTVLSDLLDFQIRGFRTLGFAYQDISEGINSPVYYIETVAIHDPVRDDVREAMDTCKGAGVRVIMVTGDVAATASEVAFESGILSEQDFTNVIKEAHGGTDKSEHRNYQILTGTEFASLSDIDILERILPNIKVLCRARPEDKLRLVSLLQQRGEVVAVTGDGTNDALALKKAQVGLSMGDGTSRAKEASDITIIDNSFSSINKGILWGRSLYLNIKRFILFQMTINVCACLIVLFGAFLGMDSPLNVTQMLWVNLIMDTFAAMALSSLPPDKRVMKELPRKSDSNIIDRTMGWQVVLCGGAFFVFLAFLWQMLWHTNISYGEVYKLFDLEHIRIFFSDAFNISKSKSHLTSYELGVFFTTFVMLQFWNMFNARYFRTGRSLLKDIIDSISKPKEFRTHFSQGFLAIATVIVIGQILIVNYAGPFFEVGELSRRDWGCIISFTSLVLFVPDLIRFFVSMISSLQHSK